MTARDKKQTLDSCPNQEVDAQESCGPCASTACDAEEDAGCDACE